MKIFFLIGQSNTGKDTIKLAILSQIPDLQAYVTCTTRPMRNGEENGREYHFVTEDKLKDDCRGGQVIELRTYQTAHGDWTYYTQKIPEDDRNYIMTGTPNQCQAVLQAYGEEVVKPIFISVSDRERLMRGILREDNNRQDYREVARRFQDEFTEYTEENLNRLNGLKRFDNRDGQLCTCIKEIIDYISEEKEYIQENDMAREE